MASSSHLRKRNYNVGKYLKRLKLYLDVIMIHCISKQYLYNLKSWMMYYKFRINNFFKYIILLTYQQNHSNTLAFKYPMAYFIHKHIITTNITHATLKHGVNKLINLGSVCIYPKYVREPMSGHCK